ncbi:hypothetical protein GF342_04600 [Candidatus Woesearchaeota archaeon]|nr:hypothetical protein [Candidatus Woesearchaeota archaeon]
MTDLTFYQGFNPRYFGQRQRQESTTTYNTFLGEHAQALEAVLSNQEEPEILGTYREGFWTVLRHLAKKEIKHCDVMRKPVWRSVKLPTQRGRNHIKESERPIRDFEQLIGISLSEAEHYFTGRTAMHLSRLAFPFEYSSDHLSLVHDLDRPLPLCQETSLDFVCDYSRYALYCAEQPEKDERKACKYIGQEGHGPFVFWTVAPHLHADLQQRGIDRLKSIEHLFDWATQAHEQNNEDHKCANTFPYATHALLNQQLITPLGLDERMPTHLINRLVAKTIARELVK